MPALTTPHEQYPALVDVLPPLVRKQRRLERKIAALKPTEAEEKILRQEIDALLVSAGIEKSQGVTCLGYDVVHCGRDGSTSLDETLLVAKLVVGGVDRDFALQMLAESTKTGDPAFWATVKPSKGAAVRLPVADRKRMAKAS